MKNESTAQSVKIQIEKKVTEKKFEQVELQIPSYYALIAGDKTYLSLKVCSSEKFIVVADNDISINKVANTLHIWLSQPIYQPCEPEIFYNHLAVITGEITAISGIKYMPLINHDLTQEDYDQIKYDEGRELINEDRRERDNDRKDEISHDYNY